MKGSILLFLMFVLGIVWGNFLPAFHFANFDMSSVVLMLLMCSVGVNLGSSKEFLDIIRKADLQIFLVPAITITGTFAGMTIFSFITIDFSLKELLAVGSGFGYYSLSSMIISKISSEALAVVALLSNIFREIISIVLTPLLVKYFGGISPIVSAGATSMDTALPVIVKFSGSAYVFHAVFNGIILTLLVPFLVVFFLNI
jgi:uncharacterized membrane protein YbjE (DUF340 family)